MQKNPTDMYTARNESMSPVENHITDAESAYWQQFYEKNDFNEGSSFCEATKDFPEIPNVVMDIGCGQGRDSISFARSGKTVLGLDRSEEGVYHANQEALRSGLGDNVAFVSCDVSNYENVAEMMKNAHELAGGEGVCYYMRFFLHSIPADVQDKLMSVLSDNAIDSDVLAVEFRTDKDAEQEKTFGVSHYRRYQNAEEFSRSLRDTYGWTDTLLEVESQGLSPYGEEDPVLYRVIAKR